MFAVPFAMRVDGSALDEWARTIAGAVDRPAADGASYVSGLLIGSDVHSQLQARSDEIYVLGELGLGKLYVKAIQVLGGRAHLVDSGSAFIAGVNRLWGCVT